jgi:hypothetical protein
MLSSSPFLACAEFSPSTLSPSTPCCRHNSRFLLIWLTLLPFTLWDTCHWGMLPVTGLVAFLLLGEHNWLHANTFKKHFMQPCRAFLHPCSRPSKWCTPP